MCGSLLRLMYGPRRSHARVKLDFTERSFVARHILLKQTQQRLRLLRTEINSLEIADLHVRLALLLQRAKDKKKVPDIDPHLHAVRVVLAIVRIVRQFHIRLHRIVHGRKCTRLRGLDAPQPKLTDKNCHWLIVYGG